MAVNFFDNCTVWPRTFKFIRKKFDNCTVWLFDNCTVRLFDNCTVVFFDNFPVPQQTEHPDFLIYVLDCTAKATRARIKVSTSF